MNTRHRKYIDSHFHFGSRLRLYDLSKYFKNTTILKASALSLSDRNRINFNPEVLLAKAHFPEKLFAFASLDYSSIFYNNENNAEFKPDKQLKDFISIGFDGIKMWLGKPTCQHDVGLTPQNSVFNNFFKETEELSIPIIFHAGDPPDFWKLSKSIKGIYNNREYPPFSFFYNQAENLASHYREIHFIFPHLLFLADDLEKLGIFLDAYPNTMLDLSPGKYFYAELSKNRKGALYFFSEYSKRILFGTDSLFYSMKNKLLPYKTVQDNISIFEMLSVFLTTKNEYPNPFPFSRVDMPFVKGLELDNQVLENIYHKNHESLMGNIPRKINFNSAVHYLSLFLRDLAKNHVKKEYITEVIHIKTKLETIKNRREK